MKSVTQNTLIAEVRRQANDSPIFRLLNGGVLHHRKPGVTYPDFG